jgi:hypothetical protein
MGVMQMGLPMDGWEYTTINLSDLPLGIQAQDLLNAGRDRWELVATTSNGMAYFKRPTGTATPAPARRSTAKASKAIYSKSLKGDMMRRQDR